MLAQAILLVILVWQARSLTRALPGELEEWDRLLRRQEHMRNWDRAVAARRKAREAVEAAGGPCSNSWWQARAMNAVVHRDYVVGEGDVWVWGDSSEFDPDRVW